MAKTRKHTFILTVIFDKECTQLWALSEVADCIHGEFYTTQRQDTDPGTFRVKRFSCVKVGA